MQLKTDKTVNESSRFFCGENEDCTEKGGKKSFAVQTGRGKKRIVFLLQEYCIKSASKKQDKCLLINRLDVLFQKRENEEEKRSF